MRKKLIDIYYEWEEKGRIFNDRNRLEDYCGGGLCNALPEKYRPDLSLFKPTDSKVYWATNINNKTKASFKEMFEFNEIRKHIVLFICAIHNEI